MDRAGLSSTLHAVDFIDRLVEAAEKLETHPRLGRVVQEFARKDLRELIFRRYRIVYLLRGETVSIVRVIHGSRDFKRLGEAPPWDLA